MATSYAIRISNVLGPVMERARRWSQSSASPESGGQVHVFQTHNEDDTALPDTDETAPHRSSISSTQTRINLNESTYTEATAPIAYSIDGDNQTAISSTPFTVPISEDTTPMPLNIGNDSAILSSPSPQTQYTNHNDTSALVLNASELTENENACIQSTTLPEDDGQRSLRLKLSDITNSDLSERERARKMHQIMTEKWNASQRTVMTVESRRLISATPHIDTEFNPNDPYRLQTGDVGTTYYTGTGATSELGCSHYRRNNKLQCSTCERWYTCRFCHDEKEDHVLIRQDTKNMLCMVCGQAQPAQQDCRSCGTRTARYFCDKCKLWDDDPQKNIYHCNDCGICRIGQGLGKDFFHCQKCGVCMSVQLQNSHRCIERSTKCDCPICGEFMFTSTLSVVFMTCGHSIHHKCYYEHMKRSYRCPTCARTIINMESQFRALDAEIENQPLPSPYDEWRCLISCNDCSARSNVPFHFLGLRCDNCSSYNTSQIRIIRPDDVATSVAPGLILNGTTNNLGPQTAHELTPQNSIGVYNTSLSNERLGDSLRGTRAIEIANRAITAAEEAIEVALGFDHGDEDLLIDDGWITESDSDDADSEQNWSDDNDDDEEELINLVGHL